MIYFRVPSCRRHNLNASMSVETYHYIAIVAQFPGCLHFKLSIQNAVDKLNDCYFLKLQYIFKLKFLIVSLFKWRHVINSPGLEVPLLCNTIPMFIILIIDELFACNRENDFCFTNLYNILQTHKLYSSILQFTFKWFIRFDNHVYTSYNYIIIIVGLSTFR